MRMKIYINSIMFNRSLSDGPGVRTVVFFQGCDLRCKGCQNPSTWEMKNGEEVEVEDLAALLRKEVWNKKITFSGGEPLMQADGLIELCKQLDGYDLAVYTGHEFSDVPEELLKLVKYVKTGPFKEELKSTELEFRGSTNQEFRRLR